MSIEFEFSPDLRANLKAMLSLRPVEVIVGTDLTDPPYPYFLEFGTSRMPAYPSARPAFEETKDQMVQVAAATLGTHFAQQRFTQPSLRAAGRAGGLVLSNRWKQLARVETGTYRRSIHVETKDIR